VKPTPSDIDAVIADMIAGEAAQVRVSGALRRSILMARRKGYGYGPTPAEAQCCQ
jgi:hypothetical protein